MTSFHAFKDCKAPDGVAVWSGEGLRTDVELLEIQMLTHPWFWKMQRGNLPSFVLPEKTAMYHPRNAGGYSMETLVPLDAVTHPDPAKAARLTAVMLAAGADPNGLYSEEYRDTPMHRVLHPVCVNLLMAARANLEARDSKGWTPLYTAVDDMGRSDSQAKRDLLAAAVLHMADWGADLVNTGGEPGRVQRRVQELRQARDGSEGAE